jgi:hypothetical protein
LHDFNGRSRTNGKRHYLLLLFRTVDAWRSS